MGPKRNTKSFKSSDSRAYRRVLRSHRAASTSSVGLEDGHKTIIHRGKVVKVPWSQIRLEDHIRATQSKTRSKGIQSVLDFSHIEIPTMASKIRRESTPNVRFEVTPTPGLEPEPEPQIMPKQRSPPAFTRHRAVGKEDRAAGPSYAIRDPKSGEITGDMRANMSYVKEDDEMEWELFLLWEQIYNLANEYFSYNIEDKDKGLWLRTLAARFSDEFVRFAGFIADGGPCGTAGWEEIFLELELRKALVCGVIWKVLREHIFASLLFGGTSWQLETLMKMEAEAGDKEGFHRTRERGTYIADVLRRNGKGSKNEQYDLPPNFPTAVNSLTSNLYTMLEPLLPNSTITTRTRTILPALHTLIYHAGTLSTKMRLDRHTIYFFPPTLNDEPFTSTNMHVFSTSHRNWMAHYNNRADWTSAEPEKGLTAEKIEHVVRYRPLVRIIASTACEAYRQGGWRDTDAQKGWRKKTLSGAIVACRWGKQRSIPPPPPGSSAEGHFVDFKDCVRRLGEAETLLEGVGEVPWWLRQDCRDPAYAVRGVPVLGIKAKGVQVDCWGFEPTWP